MPCDHVFHTDCVEKYGVATSRLRSRACPFRCWEEEREVVQPIVIPDDDPVVVVRSLAELADKWGEQWADKVKWPLTGRGSGFVQESEQ